MTIPHSHTILPAGSWDKAKSTDTVTLAWDDRHRRRIVLTTATGVEVQLLTASATPISVGTVGQATNTGINTTSTCTAPPASPRVTACCWRMAGSSA